MRAPVAHPCPTVVRLRPISAAHSFTHDLAHWFASRALARVLPPVANARSRPLAAVARDVTFLAAAGCAATAVTQPLRVVTVRMVAQLAGGTGYASPWQACATIAAEEGAAGFFKSGPPPPPPPPWRPGRRH